MPNRPPVRSNNLKKPSVTIDPMETKTNPQTLFGQLQAHGKKATRDGFGDGLLEAGKRNPHIVALCADLLGSLKMDAFVEAFPERFFQVGIAEANMMGIAAGLATAGKIPYTGTFANFSTGRVYDQIRQSIAYSHKNVKICASHAGLTLGEDGATHQILEDIGMMKMLPGMTVINPCDYNQTRAATMAIAHHYGPVYLRFGRPSWPIFLPEDLPFEIGKALHLRQGSDVSLFATGHLVWPAVEAARALAEEGISCDLINIHTIKPLDEAAVIASVSHTGCAVSCEEHNRIGGLGDSVAQVLARYRPAPQEYIAVDDSFGESGKPEELLVKYGLSTAHILEAVRRVLKRKS
jgi:transketolase